MGKSTINGNFHQCSIAMLYSLPEGIGFCIKHIETNKQLQAIPSSLENPHPRKPGNLIGGRFVGRMMYMGGYIVCISETFDVSSC